MWDPKINTEVMLAVRYERQRQEQLKTEGKFKHTLSDPEMSNEHRLAATGEEFGEVCTALLEVQGQARPRHETVADLRKELIQLAACAVGWIEHLDMDAEPNGEW